MRFLSSLGAVRNKEKTSLDVREGGIYEHTQTAQKSTYTALCLGAIDANRPEDANIVIVISVPKLRNIYGACVMLTKHLLRSVVIFLVLILALPRPTQALIIKPDYGDFKDEELQVLQEAVKEWADLFSCSDNKTVPIQFVCDNTIGPLGEADTFWKADGDVLRAVVRLKNNKIKFELDPPDKWPGPIQDDVFDALSVAKHEIGHALGWSDQGSKFMAHVEVVDGNRFYDMNHDRVFNNDDYDLQDGDDWLGHANGNIETELMWTIVNWTRYEPTLHHARVLADAYGYCVVPEPATVCLLALGGLAVLRRRK